MQLLSKKLNFALDAEVVPAGFAKEVYDVGRSVTCPDVAQQICDKLDPVLQRYGADQTLAIAYGMLVEKQRNGESLRAFWDDLYYLFPKDQTALRMLMRWYRRDQKVEAGIARLDDLLPLRRQDPQQVETAIIGLAELKAWTEIDDIMRAFLQRHPGTRSIRMRYIKILNEQTRYGDAKEIAAGVQDRRRMGPVSQELLETVDRCAEKMLTLRRDNAADVVADIVAAAPVPRQTSGLNRVVLFTGQLGTGGAERQMTRIACAFQDRHDRDEPGGLAPDVWVRHATASSGADFYLPQLRAAGVATRILAEEPDVPMSALTGIPADSAALLELLPEDIYQNTRALIPMFQNHATDVAYLWQDGGVAASALAALLAGVPRIIASFRGLPPNQRPNFFRYEMPVLYRALAALPQVTFSANSQKTATAYEDWLGLVPGTVKAIANATPPVLPRGDASDHDYWSLINARSPGCSKTVLGVFRFDDNKRPLDWVRTAAHYLQAHDDTRFVMVGNGVLHGDCAKLIAELGLGDRIFLAGIRDNIGFYMHKADLLMHLARMEGLPNVLIEAQLAGTPVLATPAGGTDEVVANGLTAHLLSTAEDLPQGELNAALKALLADETALANMGAAAIAHAGQRFSVDTVLDRTLALFEHPTPARKTGPEMDPELAPASVGAVVKKLQAHRPDLAIVRPEAPMFFSTRNGSSHANRLCNRNSRVHRLSPGPASAGRGVQGRWL